MCTIVDEEDAPVGSGVGRVSRSRGTATVFEARFSFFSWMPFLLPGLGPSCYAFTLSAESRAEILLGQGSASCSCQTESP